ncbi:MAG: hypothetical protein MJZ40_03370 [Bacteroidaceae bacterium]|nr:hypothetical protein [Bacteroidaceae bacterium]
MKKVFTLLALCLLSLVGGVQVMADYWQVAGRTNDNLYPVVTEIKADTWYALGNPRTEDDSFLGKSGLVAQLTDDCLWQFVKLSDDAEGNAIYVLQQKSTGKYLGKGFAYTENTDKAWMFTAQLATVVENTYDGENEETNIDWSLYDVRNHTANMNNQGNYVLLDDFYTDDTHANVFVFCESPANQEAPSYLCTVGGWYNYRDTNTWALYNVAPATPDQALSIWLENFGEFDPDTYETGIDPGQYGEEELQEAADAWMALQELYNNVPETQEQVSEAIARFEEAYQKLAASVKVFSYGYYMFQNYRDNGVMYGTADLKTFYTPNYEAPENEEDWTISDLRYVWEFVRIGDKNYLRNYVTNTYLGHPSKIYEELPLTEAPETDFSVEVNTSNEHGLTGWFNIIDLSIDEEDEKWQTGYGGWDAGVANCLHTQDNGKKIVYWSKGMGGSLWRVRTVPQSVLDSWLSRLDQEQLNEKLQKLYDKATATYEKAESECYQSDATRDGEFASVGAEEYEADGLLKSVEQYRTNVGDAEEGPATGLFDGDFTTYFHSDWHGTATDNINFQVDLGEAIDLLTLKIASRSHQNQAEPLKMTILGSNTLPTLFENDYDQGERGEDMTEWTECGTMTMSYDYNFGAGGLNNVVGLGVAKLAAPYRYLRFNIESTRSGKSYFTMSELRAYKTVADWTAGNLSKMDAAVLKAFQDALAEAKAALDDRLATDAIYSKLEAAYDAFLENYPDPQVLKDLKTEAQSWADSGIAGDEPGMYPQSAIDALQNAIESVTVADVMTLDEIAAGKKAINDALAAFHAALILPEAGNYMLVSQTTGAANSNRMYARRPGQSTLGWGGYSEADGQDEDVTNLQYVNYLWQLKANEDRTFSLYNYGTGAYLAKVAKSGVAMTMTTEPDSIMHFTLQSARCEDVPAFNLVAAEGVYLNFQPGGQAIVTWSTAQGHDNSAFLFEEYEAEEWAGKHRTLVGYTVGVPQVVTFPYDVTPANNRAKESVYNFLGQDAEGNFRFAAYKDGVIPAGKAFVLYSENAEFSTCAFTIGEDGVELGSIKHTYGNFFNNNGLVGVLEDVMLPAGCGYISSNYTNLKRLSVTEEEDVIASGTGYFTKCALTTEQADLTIVGNAGIVTEFEASTGVAQVVVNRTAARGTYNLMGQKVSGKLPAGLYIVEGRKVIVK